MVPNFVDEIGRKAFCIDDKSAQIDDEELVIVASDGLEIGIEDLFCEKDLGPIFVEMVFC